MTTLSRFTFHPPSMSSTPSNPRARHDAAAQLAKRAMSMVCANLPHLSGLAAVVEISADSRVKTAGVTASGRVLVSPAWFPTLTLPEATFVMAHELMHLCLESHQRGLGTDPRTFNIAHDYIINDILVQELSMPVPADGLVYE